MFFYVGWIGWVILMVWGGFVEMMCVLVVFYVLVIFVMMWCVMVMVFSNECCCLFDWCVVVGVVIFVFSDMFIVFDCFYLSIEGVCIFIIFIYWIG